MKPIIGIIFHGKIRDNYSRAIIIAGGTPIYLGVHSAIEEVLPIVSGLCFAGGGDPLPKILNENFIAETSLPDVARDYFEISAVQAGKKTNIPMLGICRGMQMINIALGGSIYQHIGESHNQKMNPLMPSHEININENSDLFNILNKKKLLVNSFHHQSLKNLAGCLSLVATGLDGVIEAVEGSNIMGFQWHPEWLQHREDEQKIFKKFVERANDYSQKTRVNKIK